MTKSLASCSTVTHTSLSSGHRSLATNLATTMPRLLGQQEAVDLDQELFTSYQVSLAVVT